MCMLTERSQCTISLSRLVCDTPQLCSSTIAPTAHYPMANCEPHSTRLDPRLTVHCSKTPSQTTKWKTLQKLILSYFHNVIHFMGQLSDNDMLRLALDETAKLVQYVSSSRKSVKLYLKTCLDFWATAEDSVRISAFLAVRRLASATDGSILDSVLKVSLTRIQQ